MNMKKMKKIIALLLALMLISCSVFALDSDKEELNSNESVYGLLSAMGIIDNTFTFNYEAAVTRMEFAKAVVSAGGYDTGFVSPEGIFSDVPVSNEYIKDIEFLAMSNIVSGDNGRFYPDRNITLDEALSIIIKAAGYSSIAEKEGGYPNGYLVVAQREKLLNNVRLSGTDISGDNMLVLLFNMLSLDVIDEHPDNLVEKDERETLLSKRHSVYHRKGIVTSNSITSLYSVSESPDKSVVIETGNENVTVGAGKTDIENMLGRRVTVYYRYNQNTNTSECLYYEPEKQNEEFSFDIDKLYGLNNNELEYETADGTKNEVLKLETPAIIYNNAYYAGTYLTKADFNGMSGTISAIDNDGDGKIEVLDIDAYNTYIVKSAASKDKVFYDKVTGEKVDVNDEGIDLYEMIYADGSEAVFEDLFTDVVVSVAKSAAASKVKSLKVVLSAKKISGLINRISNEDGKIYISLDNGEKYNVSDKVTNVPDIGTGVTVFLDMFDNIVYFETKYLADKKYGLAIKKIYNTDEERVYIRLFTREATLENLRVAERVTIDGTSYKDVNVIDDVLSKVSRVEFNSSTFLPQGVVPVRYKLNEAKEIVFVDTPDRGAYESENSLTVIPKPAEDLVYSSDGLFGFSIPVNAQTTIIKVVLTEDDRSDFEQYPITEEGYSFIGLNHFVSDEPYTSYMYFKTDPNSPYTDLMLGVLSGGGGDIAHGEPMLVFDEISQVYNEAAEEVFYQVSGYYGGKETKLFVSEKFEAEFLAKNYQKGDVVRFTTNSKGYINSVDTDILRFDWANGKMTHNHLGSDPERIDDDQDLFTTVGEVKSREEGLISFYYSGSGSAVDIKRDDSAIEASNVYYANISSTIPVIVVDTVEDEVYAGTYDDIIPRDNDKDKYSIVLLRYRSSELKEVVVYNTK